MNSLKPFKQVFTYFFWADVVNNVWVYIVQNIFFKFFIEMHFLICQFLI